jgi:hypothetical protein
MTLNMKARVHDGRLVLDEPTDLPEGSEVELLLADEGDDLDPDDRARLQASLQRSAEQLRRGARDRRRRGARPPAMTITR